MSTVTMFEHPILTQLQEKLDRYNFYYLRDAERQPVGLVIVGKKDEVICRGVAICGDEEQHFDKIEGLKWAGKRILRAFKKKESGDPINPFTLFGAVSCVMAQLPSLNKVEYNIKPTDHEKYILEKAKKNGNNGN